MVHRVYDATINCEYTAAYVPEGTKALSGKTGLDRNGNWAAPKFKTPLGDQSKGKADLPATTSEANKEASK